MENAAVRIHNCALKQHCNANDVGSSNRSTRYFTPVGTAKGRGVSALRPTLQMQNSYDVEALTTNSMIARPLEIAKEGKPKQSAFGQTKASLKDGDNNEDNSGGWCTVEKRK